jgi:Fe-S-cluster containining protein
VSAGSGRRPGAAGTALPCGECQALCCRYLATEIDPPRSRRDFDDIRWYLFHQGVSVFIDHDGAWFLAFDSVCRELDPSGRCRRYAERPQLCREHGRPAGSCEHFGPLHAVRFASAAEFDHWLEAGRPDGRRRAGTRGGATGSQDRGAARRKAARARDGQAGGKGDDGTRAGARRKGGAP